MLETQKWVATHLLRTTGLDRELLSWKFSELNECLLLLTYFFNQKRNKCRYSFMDRQEISSFSSKARKKVFTSPWNDFGQGRKARHNCHFSKLCPWAYLVGNSGRSPWREDASEATVKNYEVKEITWWCLQSFRYMNTNSKLFNSSFQKWYSNTFVSL